MKRLDLNRHEPQPNGLYLGNGARNHVFLATLKINRNDTRRQIQMAVRIPKTSQSAAKLYDEAKMRDRLIKAEIPVAHETYRLHPEESLVYCTDLTRNGAYYVFSDTNRTADDAEWKKRIASEKSEAAPNGNEALRQLRMIAVDCTRADIEFMHADAIYFIVDKQTRRVEARIGDYKHAVNRQQSPDDTLINNLLVVRAAAVSRCDVFGMSAAEISAIFDTEIDIALHEFGESPRKKKGSNDPLSAQSEIRYAS